MTVIERGGRMLGRVVLTLVAPEPAGIHPVGIDLNETNALVAVDPDGRELFVSGKLVKVRNLRTSKARKRLQRTLASRKAEGKDTRSVRRALKRHGRARRNRTRTFSQQAAVQLVRFAGPDSVLVFEDLPGIPQPKRGQIGSRALRRRLSLWQRAAIRTAVEHKAQEAGLLVAEVDPRYTSQTCSRCGLRGARKASPVLLSILWIRGARRRQRGDQRASPLYRVSARWAVVMRPRSPGPRMRASRLPYLAVHDMLTPFSRGSL